MTTHDPIAAERARSDAWHARHDALAAEVAPLSPLRARQLAFALVTEMIAQLVAPGAHPLAALLVMRLADVVELVAEMRHRLSSELVPASFADIGQRADRLHARLFVQVCPRGTWPDELRLPADAAEAVRRACEDDVHGALAALYTGARATLDRARLDPVRLDDLWQEAAREARASPSFGDIADGHPSACGCPDCDANDILRDHLAADHAPITTPEERAWCRDLAARATSGTFATKEPAT